VRHLADAWLRTARRVGARDDIAHAGADLLGRYAEGHRRYHGLAHLDDVLRSVDELAHLAADADAVRLAAWYHDAVYDPAATDNEERSAALAETELTRLRVSDRVVAEVARLVRATAAHEPAPDDSNAAVLCDADLAILAADPSRYQQYVDAVREEYASVEDETFTRGRAAILRRLLERQWLFSTQEARATWEDAARANMTAELSRLE